MQLRAFSADYLFTAHSAPLANGIVIVDEEGTIQELSEQLPDPSIPLRHIEGIICPGFINTHCHLELSHLKGKVQKETRLHGFIQELQAIRKADETEVLAAIVEADREMQAAGIVAVGDISNGISSLPQKQKSALYYHSFVEAFGFNPEKAVATYQRSRDLWDEWQSANLAASICPHSPYSMSAPLMNLILQFSATEQGIISIHNQETASENQMFIEGKGAIAEMLRNFGNPMEAHQSTGKSSLQSYLGKIPSDMPTLLVHNTFTSEADMDWAESQHHQLYWCFCPKANLYIEGRIPNIPLFLSKGLRCTLGTDSLASNDALSILSEMQAIQHKYPQLDSFELLNMATKNGAAFLRIQENYGSLEVGKKAGIVALHAATPESLANAHVERLA